VQAVALFKVAMKTELWTGLGNRRCQVIQQVV